MLRDLGKPPPEMFDGWYLLSQQSMEIWLVVWTPLKNISQLGWLFPIYGKIKNGNQTTNQCLFDVQVKHERHTLLAGKSPTYRYPDKHCWPRFTMGNPSSINGESAPNCHRWHGMVYLAKSGKFVESVCRKTPSPNQSGTRQMVIYQGSITFKWMIWDYPHFRICRSNGGKKISKSPSTPLNAMGTASSQITDFQKKTSFNGNSRILKWSYYTIFQAIFWGYIPWTIALKFRPYTL